MNNKKLLQINFGGTTIKGKDTYLWAIQGGMSTKNRTGYTADELEEGEVYLKMEYGIAVGREQFIYSNGCLVSLSNDAHIAKDYKCQLADAKKENWCFVKVSTAMSFDFNQKENNEMLGVLEGKGLMNDHLNQMKKLNDTGDTENTMMVNQMLKTRYGKHLEI